MSLGGGSFKEFNLGAQGVTDSFKRQAAAQVDLLKQAEGATSFERLQASTNNFRELFSVLQNIAAIDSLQAGGAEQAFKRGVSGTQTGTTLSAGAGGSADLQAVGQSLDRAKTQQDMKLAGILGFAGVDLAGPSTANLFGQGASNVAQRIFSAFGFDIAGAGGNTGATSGRGVVGGPNVNKGSAEGQTGIPGFFAGKMGM